MAPKNNSPQRIVYRTIKAKELAEKRAEATRLANENAAATDNSVILQKTLEKWDALHERDQTPATAIIITAILVHCVLFLFCLLGSVESKKGLRASHYLSDSGTSRLGFKHVSNGETSYHRRSLSQSGCSINFTTTDILQFVGNRNCGGEPEYLVYNGGNSVLCTSKAPFLRKPGHFKEKKSYWTLTRITAANGSQVTNFSAGIQTFGRSCPKGESNLVASEGEVTLGSSRPDLQKSWTIEAADENCMQFKIKIDSQNGPKYLTMSSDCSIKSLKLAASNINVRQQLWTLFKVDVESRPQKKVAIACESNLLQLHCPDEQILKILDVTYGRSSSKVCPRPLDEWPGGDDDSACSTSSVDAVWFRFISSRCDGRQSCMAFAYYWIGTSYQLSRIYKYAEVRYKCMTRVPGQPELPSCLPKHENCEINFGFSAKPLPCCDNMTCEFGRCIACKALGAACKENLECCGGNNVCVDRVCTASAKNQTGTMSPVPSGSRFVRVCEFNNVDLYCPAGQVIKIVSATYGRDSFKLCTHGHEAWSNEPIYDDRLCRNNSTNAQWFQHMSNRCNNRRGCTALASASVAGDPCGATYKYVEVVYNCETPKSPNDELPFCLPEREDCKRQFGPTGEPGKCCSGMTCELDVCVKCLSQGASCSYDLQCCGENNYCVDNKCQYQESPPMMQTC